MFTLGVAHRKWAKLRRKWIDKFAGTVAKDYPYLLEGQCLNSK